MFMQLGQNGLQIGIFFFENRFIFCINGMNGKDDLSGISSGIEFKMDDLRTADRLLPSSRQILFQEQFDQIFAFQQDCRGLIDRLIWTAQVRKSKRKY